MRNIMEWFVKASLFCCVAIAILVTLAIVLLMLIESIRFFKLIPISDFLFGLRWAPGALTTEAPLGYFGIVPLFLGTFLITLIAMGIAIPLGLFSAIYLSQYASGQVRTIVKPILEILAGIPTVVYGFFAVIAVSPLLHDVGTYLGLSISSESALGIGIVMGIMITPYIASLSDDVLASIPGAIRDGSLALGATFSESIKRAILPAAFPGIMAAILLAISRAIGETMVVVMAAGYSARLTANPFDAVTTVTVQIVSLLTGDQAFDNPKTLAAFALGLTLFFITLLLNLMAIRIVRHYREKYD
ncbi:MAG: phosphate ABC transporter permease subunit PstC [Alphaproteobacteria bacterium]|nr:phosphate ABC transporter permease subunit PstC [Alphaproteobacteria bacterium]